MGTILTMNSPHIQSAEHLLVRMADGAHGNRTHSKHAALQQSLRWAALDIYLCFRRARAIFSEGHSPSVEEETADLETTFGIDGS